MDEHPTGTWSELLAELTSLMGEQITLRLTLGTQDVARMVGRLKRAGTDELHDTSDLPFDSLLRGEGIFLSVGLPSWLEIMLDGLHSRARQTIQEEFDAAPMPIDQLQGFALRRSWVEGFEWEGKQLVVDLGDGLRLFIGRPAIPE
jgi:hypothetical protein